MNRTEQKWYYT